jgi:hypothetical protein
VLRHPVELVRELAAARRPGGCEAFVGDSPEKQRSRGHHLVQLELVSVGTALELERPATSLEALGPARILRYPVHGDELRYDELAHAASFSVRPLDFRQNRN